MLTLGGTYTALYAPPQQKRGAAPDPRDDVYALGVIAYQLLVANPTAEIGPDFDDELTAQGYRSPMQSFVLPSTVKIIRLRQRQFLVRHQSHPRHVDGSLTLTQIAQMLDPVDRRDGGGNQNTFHGGR